MEDTILLKILEVQNEILAELRLLRKALTTDGLMMVDATETAAAPTPPPAATTVPQPAPEPIAQAPTQTAAPATPPPPGPATEPAPAAAPRQNAPGGMLTLDDLADLGGQFLDTSPRRKTRVKPVDASDLSGSILDEIKAKNRAKRSAFAEFDKFNRDR